MKDEPKNYGFIKPVIEDKHYRFGSGDVSLATPPQPDGQWDAFVPKDEFQNIRGIETYGCTLYGSENQTETYLKRMSGGEYNYSERALGVEVGLKPPGADPQKVYEKIRKIGLALDSLLPFDSSVTSIKDFYSPVPLPADVKKSEQDFLNSYVFQHDWVADGNKTTPEIMKTALQYSPLGVAVYAWATNDGDIYVRLGDDCHWVCIYGYVDGQYWKCFDSYDNTHKKLVWDFGFFFVKRINVEKNLIPYQKSFLDILKSYLAIIVNLLKKNEQTKPVNPTPDPTPTPPTPRVSLLGIFCDAITHYENISVTYCNPGALRWSSYVQSLGATSERAGFAVFPNATIGRKALEQFVTDASLDRLKAYHQCTIKSFFASYAPEFDKNKPLLYAQYVSSKVGVPIETKLKDII
jgi:hypothetical protein